MIQIYNGTLTSKERVLRTFNHEKADRVPIGYFANPGIQKRVAAALGVLADKDSVNDALGVDFKGLMPAYTGKPLFTAPGPERHVHPADTGTTVIFRWRKPTTRSSQTGPCRTRMISTTTACWKSAKRMDTRPSTLDIPAFRT